MNILTNLENEKVIEVFSMVSKPEIMGYRKNHMEKVPYERRLIEAYTDYVKPLEESDVILDDCKVEYWNSGIFGGSESHSLRKPFIDKEKYKIMCDLLTNSYFNGELAEKSAKKIVYSCLTVEQLLAKKKELGTLDRYLLITENYEPITYRIGGSVMSNILVLPKELFLLQLLENGEFEYVSTQQIDEQLRLFDINKVASFNISDINDLISYGIIKSDSFLSKRMEGGNLILSRVKNIK